MAETSCDIFIIAAPSGAGKSTLAGRVLGEFPQLAFSVSATTRAPRVHEVDGEHYYFLSEAAFRQKIEAGAFLEWEEVYPGRFYGTLKAEVDRILAAGQKAVFDIDVEGALNIKQQYGPRALAVFIQPPSVEVLRERLQNRGTDSPEEIEKRYQKARKELTYAPRFDYVLTNDRLETAVEELRGLIGGKM